MLLFVARKVSEKTPSSSLWFFVAALAFGPLTPKIVFKELQNKGRKVQAKARSVESFVRAMVNLRYLLSPSYCLAINYNRKM